MTKTNGQWENTVLADLCTLKGREDDANKNQSVQSKITNINMAVINPGRVTSDHPVSPTDPPTTDSATESKNLNVYQN